MISFSTRNFEDNVNVTIHKSHLGSGDVSYAKVQRKTTFAGNILSKVLAKTSVFDESTLFHVANLFHNAIVELLQEGKAVNAFDLGTLYLKPESSMEGDALADVPPMTVSFTPSEIAVKAVRDVPVGSDVTQSREPQISSVMNVTSKGGATFSAKDVLRMKGQLLKVAGAEDATGIFLVPAAKSDFTTVGNDWIQVKADDLIDNTNTQIEFVLPATVTAGTYKLVVKTASSDSRILKTVRTGVFGGTITVV